MLQPRRTHGGPEDLSDSIESKPVETTAEIASAPVGRREAGKRERRRRIIEAARALIRETGNAGLSMRALAARAGVSLATPYNLFGSKRDRAGRTAGCARVPRPFRPPA